MDQFDRGVVSESAFTWLAGVLFAVLSQPLAGLLTGWMSRNMSTVAQWGLILLNSAMWGFGLAFLILLMRVLLKKRATRCAKPIS
jgi:tellurite resistance protein TehA-like permease